MSLELSPWSTPVEQPGLDAHSVHLWRFRLDVSAAQDFLLSDEERLRAERLRDPQKASTWVVARSSLRQILAGYVGIKPEELVFAVNAHGKPHLVDGQRADIRFNMAHSGEWGLCAVARGDDVGVDVERINGALDHARLAARFFSKEENARLMTVPASRRRREFFRIWTRKEAWLKAKGGGFSETQLALDPLFLDHCSVCDSVWQLRLFPVARHYLAAVAVRPEVSRLQRWHLSDSAPL